MQLRKSNLVSVIKTTWPYDQQKALKSINKTHYVYKHLQFTDNEHFPSLIHYQVKSSENKSHFKID